METDNIHSIADDQLLDSFFAQARAPIADNGFTLRVMSALPRNAPALNATINLRRWHIALNALCAIGIIALLTSINISERLVASVHTSALHLMANILALDTDSILVNILLAMHRMPDLLPSFTQMIALFAITTLLLYMFFARLARE